jgi:hypothetical protein
MEVTALQYITVRLAVETAALKKRPEMDQGLLKQVLVVHEGEMAVKLPGYPLERGGQLTHERLEREAISLFCRSAVDWK